MKIYRRLSFWYSILILIVLSIAILISLTYGKNERLIPLIIATAGAVLTILVLIGEKYPDFISRFDFSITEIAIEGLETGNGHAAAGNIPFRGVLKFLAWTVWALVLILFIGFHFAIPVFVFTFLKIFGRLAWIRSIVAAVIATGVLYGLFEIVLKVALFKGILLGELLPHL